MHFSCLKVFFSRLLSKSARSKLGCSMTLPQSSSQLINMLINKSAVRKCYLIGEIGMPTLTIKCGGFTYPGAVSSWVNIRCRCQLTRFNTFFKEACNRLIFSSKCVAYRRRRTSGCGSLSLYSRRLLNLRLWRLVSILDVGSTNTYFFYLRAKSNHHILEINISSDISGKIINSLLTA